MCIRFEKKDCRFFDLFNSVVSNNDSLKIMPSIDNKLFLIIIGTLKDREKIIFFFDNVHLKHVPAMCLFTIMCI
jgi:hypothetical protein